MGIRLQMVVMAVMAAMAWAVRRAAPLPCASIISKGSRARTWNVGVWRL